MGKAMIPEGYTPVIDYMESQRAIKKIKDFFQQELAYGLQLRRVSAPLFVAPETGLNDNLNGVERTVSFTVKDMGEKTVEIVQSLAKWKRMALGKYDFKPGTGLYTDMNAIRRDEELDRGVSEENSRNALQCPEKPQRLCQQTVQGSQDRSAERDILCDVSGTRRHVP